MNLNPMNFRSTPRSCVLISTDFKIIDVTDFFLQDFSYTRDQIMTMNVNDLPKNGKVTPMFNDQGIVEQLLYEFLSPESLYKMRTDFISLASHELKTPITALKLQVQMAKRMMEKKPDGSLTPYEVKKFIERASKDVARLSQLVDDMVEVEVLKDSAGLKLSWFNLQDFMDDFLKRSQDNFLNFNERVNINIQCPVMVFWDNNRIEQVLTNLLSNAFRYGQGSPITISVSHGGGNVYMTVTDEGPGIPKERQKNIFEMFGKDGQGRDGGIGLGLFVCKEIIVSHGGNIQLKSSAAKGSQFTIQIPLKSN